MVSDEAPAEVDSEYREYLSGNRQIDWLLPNGTEDDITAYVDLLKIGDNPLTVTEEDLPKKRYKAYRKWMRGKSFFKQQPVD